MGLSKKSRFWTNIKDFIPKLCKKDCENIIQIEDKKQHKTVLGNGYTIIDGKKVLSNTKALRDVHRLHFGDKNRKGCVGGGNNRLLRYRIPEKLIIELLEKCK